MGSWDPGILGSRGPGSRVWMSDHATYLPGVLVFGLRSGVSGSRIWWISGLRVSDLGSLVLRSWDLGSWDL